ncbi:MAG: non-canonical purine NTP pyrophosphatase [Vampirovibrio sp.]|nr:non-canonical purine NTP pyrophosphatase [Vampirovibrio sp.]
MHQTPPTSPTTIRLMIASENVHKLEEMQAYFTQENLPITVVLPKSLEGLEETGDTFTANALLKVQFAYQQAKDANCQWVLGDDSGFSVEALAGQYGLPLFPGVQSNRWLTTERRGLLLGEDEDAPAFESPITHPQRCMAVFRLLGDNPNRKGAYHCAMVLLEVSSGKMHTMEGLCPVSVAPTPELLGTNGFGYDPMVYPLISFGIDEATGELSDRTMAQWSMAEKNAISHRGKALAQVATFFRGR